MIELYFSSKKRYAAIKACSQCKRKLNKTGKVLVSLTQLGPELFCKQCAVSKLEQSLNVLLDLIVKIRNS